MTRNAKEWLKVAACAAAAVVFVGAAIALSRWLPMACKPGDPGIYVGGMLVGGCPEKNR
jgi:predicted Na+-dependent transporter